MAEFNIRLFAFKRMSRDRELLFREVAYSSLIGSHYDPKKIPKSKQEYWRIGGENSIDLERKKQLAEMMRSKREQFKNINNV